MLVAQHKPRHEDISNGRKNARPRSYGRLAKALVFICGADTVAVQAAAESGSERDIKNARTLFLRLKPGDRRAALAMLDE
jgi:hypothetical protein